MNKKTACLFSTFIAALSAVSAETVYFGGTLIGDGANSGNSWDTASNWLLEDKSEYGKVPQEGDNIVIDGNYITFDSSTPRLFVTSSAGSFGKLTLQNLNSGTTSKYIQLATLAANTLTFSGIDFIRNANSGSAVIGLVTTVSTQATIVVNGDVKYKAGDYVQTITTTEEGATSDPLYLGWYRVREVSTKEGYFIGANEFEIELTYHDQSIDVFTEYITAYNERQHMKVKLEKEIEENPYYPNPDAYKDVIFGVFSEEDITNADGEILLEKDSLVDCFGLNDSYQGQSSVDFPCGTKWYVKELQTAEGFVLNTTQYPFEFTPQPQEIPLIWIDLNEDGTVIKNEWMKGEVELYKKSDFDGKYLKDAVYGIFRESDGLKVDELITDENGYAKSNVTLYYGGYYIQELKQPAHYYLDGTKYYFFIGSEGEAFQTIHYDLEDTPKIGHLIPEYSEGKIDEGKDMTSPDTGDHSMPLWIPQALLAISGAAIVGVLFQQKALKKKKSR